MTMVRVYPRSPRERRGPFSFPSAALLLSVIGLLGLTAGSVAGGSDVIRLSGVGGAGVQPSAHRPVGFSITGSVDGLYPGATILMSLRVSNGGRHPIVVNEISTSVSSTAPLCPASDVTVGSFSGALHVPGGKSATVAVPVSMVHSAPDACQGVTFPFSYSGTASRP